MAERNLSRQTLFWHDYETTGTNPQKDSPVQFAGVRTDYEFNQLEEPLVVYCKPSLDSLPHPDACLITGITPAIADKLGLCQAEFTRLIYEQMARPNTCSLGYNSLRYDDEVTRNCLYRNFYDPYAREWQHGNSRWDIIDVARAAHALRPQGIVWPKNIDGRPDFKLEEICKANLISHDTAHDALSDVYATQALAKLIKKAQPKLYGFLWKNRNKSSALELMQLGRMIPVVHISGKYPALKNCLAIVLPICKHPENPNGVIVYDLSIDPEPLLTLSASEIRERIFTATKDLPEGVERIPLKTVHINKCPVLAPLSVIRLEDERRLELDLEASRKNIHKINASYGLVAKLAEVFKQQNFDLQESDPDLEIYTGGFFSDADKRCMALIRSMSSIELTHQRFSFSDQRLPEMLFRYRARNYPETLTNDEAAKWRKFCVERLTGLKPGAGIVLIDYFARLKELHSQDNANSEMLKELENYAFEKMHLLGIDVSS